MSTALEEAMRADLRRMRADELVNRVMQIIRPFLDPEKDRAPRDVHYALKDLFMEQGVEVLTDYHRAQIGLPPRTRDGWTAEEIVALERIRLDAMMQPRTMTIPVPAWDAIQAQKAADAAL